MAQKEIPIFFRLLATGFFLFAAIAPGWILFWSLAQVIADPASLNALAVVFVSVSASLLYFFLLLAYRSFSGRGRTKDDGLLPVWAMRGFIHSFGIFAVLMICFGFFENRLLPIIGGTLYLFAAYGALRGLNVRGDSGNA